MASAFRRKIEQLAWWQSTTVGFAEITCVPAQPFSARTPWDRNRTLWCGYVVRVDGVSVYVAGDCGYSPQFTAIGDRCPSIDVALLPIGAYEPRWFMAPVHMNPDEAVRAHLDVRPRVSIGMHFGTFSSPMRGLTNCCARWREPAKRMAWVRMHSECWISGRASSNEASPQTAERYTGSGTANLRYRRPRPRPQLRQILKP